MYMKQFDSVVLGALDIAQTEALTRKNSEISAYHLFWGLLANPQTYSARALKKYKGEVKKALDKLPSVSSSIGLDQLRQSSGFAEWITLASSHSVQNGRQEITETDLLRFLPKVLPDIKINYEDLTNAEKSEESEVPSFLVNLNELAEQGKLDPVIGRTKEIRAVMEILGRRGKNNPVLVGSAGVGKTAIVEGLADLIVRGKVPEDLKGKTVYSLEMGSLVAGTKFRGEFEERLQKLMKFMKAQAGQSILFIDEIHMLVGAGKTDGAMDAANLLKPALARGDLNCIGATTPNEFQKFILGDSALERRFRSVPVDEPTVEDSIEIMMGVKEKQEIHHGVKISDEAIYASVFLSNQYITDKNLPDKAIDLVDEAASAMKLSLDAMPADLVELESEIRSKLIYSKVEKNNKDILNEVKKLTASFEEKKAAWEKEVLAVKKVSGLKNQLEKLKFDLEQAERKMDYESASKIKYSLIPEIQKQLEAIDHTLILKKEHIAQVIARQTGIPVEKILKSKQESILELEKYLNSSVFAQTEPLHEISETIMAAHAGLTDPKRPLGSFLLLGPSGVGKTETAKSICRFLFNSERNMIRIDMSEYSEKHSVAKLIGAPAGYVGYDEGGVLTEAIRKKPYAVILFDEIEKAHPDFADILLQILDDGRLTDNKGRTVDFKNTVIFLTSNSKDYQNEFKPEVLGRLDAILNYKTLGKSVMTKLVEKQLLELNEKLKEKNLKIDLDQKFKDELAILGFDEKYGARPLAHVFQKMVVRPLSKKVLMGEVLEGNYLMSYINEDQVEIRKNS